MHKQSPENVNALSTKKTGYLKEDFRLFYNADHGRRSFPFHYHDFHKILFLIEGNISYRIEGYTYDLQPGDIILVSAGEIHSPLIHDDSLYERIIIYLSTSAFSHTDAVELSAGNASSTDLLRCFTESSRRGMHLIRPDADMLPDVLRFARELGSAAKDHTFGSDLLRKIKVQELLIRVNRSLFQTESELLSSHVSNPVLLDIMAYIKEHLTEEELTIDRIADHAGLTRSYMMHLFKKETGTTIGVWLTEKRLFIARSAIQAGMPITQACYQCGFGSYNAFYHAWRKKYGAPPTGKAPVSHTIEGE